MKSDFVTEDYLYTHPAAYDYLVLYFLPDLSEPEFQRYAAAEIDKDERRCYCRHMTAWLPYEKHYAEIAKRIAAKP